MTTPREPGWHPDPENPATLQRYWDGSSWTDDSRPTGYVTQPGGPQPVATPAADTTPVFGAAPPETGGPQAARRRLRAAQVAGGIAVALALLALLLVLTGVL